MVNDFLESHGLPKAKRISQNEYESTKTYLILFVNNDLWESKIQPVIEFYKEYDKNLAHCLSKKAFDQQLLKSNVKLPEQDLLLESMQDALRNIYVFTDSSSDKGKISPISTSLFDDEGYSEESVEEDSEILPVQASKIGKKSLLDGSGRYDIYLFGTGY